MTVEIQDRESRNRVAQSLPFRRFFLFRKGHSVSKSGKLCATLYLENRHES